MAYTLTGFRYVGTDPGAVGVGMQWLNSTTYDLYERNSSNTGWIKVGNVNSQYYGQLPTTGGNMTGAITGSHGLAPLDSPSFTTSATRDNVELATTADLDALDTTLRSLIDTKIQTGLSTATQGISSTDNIAISYGIEERVVSSWVALIGGGTYFKPTLPVFNDGQTADINDCHFCVAISRYGAHDDGVNSGNKGMYIQTNGTGGYRINWYYDGGTFAQPSSDMTVGISWMVIAVR